MTLTPNIASVVTLAGSTRNSWMRDGTSHYAINYSTSNGAGIAVFDLQTRTIVTTPAGPWTSSGVPIRWNSIDHTGTLWGQAESPDDINPVLYSCDNFGAGTVVNRGTYTSNTEVGSQNQAWYRESFSDNSGNAAVFWLDFWGRSDVWTDTDLYIYRYHNGVLSSLKPSVVTGTAFMPSAQFFQDEYGDVWNVGHDRFTATKAYFWRVLSNGSSPITGDFHAVATGMPARRPLEGAPDISSPSDYFYCWWNGKRHNGDFVIWWEGSWNATGDQNWLAGDPYSYGTGSEYYVRVNSSTWTVTETVTFDTMINNGVRLSEYRSPEPPNTNYLLLQSAYQWDVPNPDWEIYDLSTAGTFTSMTAYFTEWGSLGGPSNTFFFDYDLVNSPKAMIVTDYSSTIWFLGFTETLAAITGSLDDAVSVASSIAATYSDPVASNVDGVLSDMISLASQIMSFTPMVPREGSGRVIDAREGRGDLVILGKSLVLPRSSDDSNPPLKGAMRYNPLTQWPQIFNGEWSDLGGTSTITWGISQYRVIGRTAPGYGPVQQINLGDGLSLMSGELAYTVSETKPAHLTGSHRGTVSANLTIPMGFAPKSFVIANCHAQALIAPTSDYEIAIHKRTPDGVDTTIGTFAWTAGNLVATVTITDSALAELDYVYLQCAETPDTTIAHLAFSIKD